MCTHRLIQLEECKNNVLELGLMKCTAQREFTLNIILYVSDSSCVLYNTVYVFCIHLSGSFFPLPCVCLSSVKLRAMRTQYFWGSHPQARLRPGLCLKSWPGSPQRQADTCYCPTLAPPYLLPHTELSSSQNRVRHVHTGYNTHTRTNAWMLMHTHMQTRALVLFSQATRVTQPVLRSKTFVVQCIHFVCRLLSTQPLIQNTILLWNIMSQLV